MGWVLVGVVLGGLLTAVVASAVLSSWLGEAEWGAEDGDD